MVGITDQHAAQHLLRAWRMANRYNTDLLAVLWERMRGPQRRLNVDVP